MQYDGNSVVKDDLNMESISIGLEDAPSEGEKKKKDKDKRKNWTITIGNTLCSLLIQYHQYHDLELGVNSLIPSPSVVVIVLL